MEGVFDRTFSLEAKKMARGGDQGGGERLPCPATHTCFVFPFLYTLLLCSSSLSLFALGSHLPSLSFLLCLFAPHAHDLTSL